MAKKKHEDFQLKFIRKSGGGFFRVYKDLFYHPKFQELSPNAKMIFIAMGIASNGQREFTFPYSAYKGIVSKSCFIRAKEQLKAAGFIDEKHYRTIANRYFLSDRWKE